MVVEPTEREGVSPLELFFDLVFVFAVSQLSAHLLGRVLYVLAQTTSLWAVTRRLSYLRVAGLAALVVAGAASLLLAPFVSIALAAAVLTVLVATVVRSNAAAT